MWTSTILLNIYQDLEKVIQSLSISGFSSEKRGIIIPSLLIYHEGSI